MLSKCVLLLLFIAACSKDELEPGQQIQAGKLAVANEASVLKSMGGTKESVGTVIMTDDETGESYDLAYKMYEPYSEAPTPLIIAIHGGGFSHGSYLQQYNAMVNNQLFGVNYQTLDRDKVAFVSVGYRLLGDGENTVSAPLNDAKKMVEYFHGNAQLFNVDPDKIILYGCSAGATAALWVGLNFNLPYIKGIICNAPQSTMDPYEWRNIFYQYNDAEYFNSNAHKYGSYVGTCYGTYNPDKIHAYSAKHKLHFLDQMDASDPELLLGSSLSNDFLHRYTHIVAINQRAGEVGLSSKISYIYPYPAVKEGIMAFVARKCR